MDAQYYFRAIGQGLKTEATFNTNNWKRGVLNMGPLGQGYLLWGGYMPDVKMYFCPSGAGYPVKLTTGYASSPGAPV